MRLLELLQRILPPGLHVQPEQPILCGDSEPEPDLSVIRGSINDYVAEHPRTAELVIEIYVSSHDYDRSKLRAYAIAGVKEMLAGAGTGETDRSLPPTAGRAVCRARAPRARWLPDQYGGSQLHGGVGPPLCGLTRDRAPAAKPPVQQANAKKEPGLA